MTNNKLEIERLNDTLQIIELINATKELYKAGMINIKEYIARTSQLESKII